jgi:hypothetical protein
MVNKIIFLLCFAIPFFCMAQNLRVEYEYDKSGNRTSRKTIYLSPPQVPPAPPEDSLQVTSNECFVEKVAQVEMKIYPNPATEKIMLTISNMDNFQTGILQLYSLSGQLLQTRLLSEAKVEISLAGLPKGAYILKVQINDTVEDWKIIKQ